MLEQRKLVGGDELFFDASVMCFYDKVLNEWKFDSKKIALLLGCSKHKPYSKSFMHRKVIRMLEYYGLDCIVQQYIVGEPLTICPREWEEVYPAAHYDFPPEKLGEKGRTVFISRLRRFFKKAKNYHSIYIVFAPNHYRTIILEACEGLFEPIIVPYNIFSIPRLLQVLNNVKNNI